MHTPIYQKRLKNTLMEIYKHPIHVKLEEKGKEVGGHRSMDYRLIVAYKTACH